MGCILQWILVDAGATPGGSEGARDAIDEQGQVHRYVAASKVNLVDSNFFRGSPRPRLCPDPLRHLHLRLSPFLPRDRLTAADDDKTINGIKISISDLRKF